LSFEPQLTPKKQIRNLIMILSAAVVCAALLTMGMLYTYGPEAHYYIKNALLSPDVIAKISLNEKNGKTSHKPTIDKIEFSYQDPETKKRINIPLDSKTYNRFYSTIEGDKNISEVPDPISAAFNQLPAAALILNFQDSEKTLQVFQEVQFLFKGDYYRLQLREASGTRWIYFYHPHIYDDAFRLFTSSLTSQT
jgi:hypothetical protein